MRSLLLSLFCTLVAVNAFTATPAEIGVRADELAKTLLSHHVAGVSVAIAIDNREVFARGYGMANLEHSVAVTPATVFHIDSISKNILAAVVLQLVEQGKLNLDDDVTKFVPEAPTHGHHVTMRQLLNHTSGIFSFTSLPDAEENEHRDLNHEQVLALIKDRPFDFEPGTSWRYDNSAFYLAGMVVERVTKQDYGSYVREHVFKPLGMNTALLCDARMVVPRLASGYDAAGDTLVHAPYLSWKLPSAAGAVCATAVDLLKWEEGLDSGRVLSASSLRLMRTPTTLADGTNIDYGLGTRLGSLDGHRVFGHTGSGGGFNTVLESFPDDHVTIVVLVNTTVGPERTVGLASDIARGLLGLPKKKVVRDLPVPKEELAAFVGVTFDSDEGPVEIFEHDDKLHYRIPGTSIEGLMLRQAPYIFAVDDHTEVHFVMRNGHPVWAQVYDGGLMLDAKVRTR